MADFTGFPVAGLDFYEDLEDDNSKRFWTAHKPLYEELVRAPMLALLAALAPEFGPGKAFRPYRDLRYSADKTPYKTHQGGFVNRGQSTGLYVQVDASGVLTGGGCYDLSGARLHRYREAVDDDRTGGELAAVVDALTAAGYDIAGDRLATRPRGTPPDHPRLELLRHRGLYAARSHGAPPYVHEPTLAEHVAADWRAYAPLLDWMDRHVPDPDG